MSMRKFAILPAIWLAAFAGAAAAADEVKPVLPDPAYCSQRDADPAKCVIQNGPPRNPYVRENTGVGTTANEVKPALPDPSYCSQRDADPAKCVIQDGPPPSSPYVRKKPPVVLPKPPVVKP